MRSLVDRITPSRLEAAWLAVLSNDAEDGAQSASVRDFVADAPNRLARIAAELADGTYRPRRLTRVEKTKESGGVRVIDIPAVADRVVERAVLDVITPFVDPVLSSAAYGYRPGIGVADAVQRVVALRDEGHPWALRTDVDDCFPTLPRDLAVGLLLRCLPDHSLDQIIEMLTTRRTSTRQGVREVAGVPQGTSLSPLLCNLVLEQLDRALLDRGFGVVRYADDLTVVCATRGDAEEALGIARRVVEELGMSLGDDKTEIMDFASGFCFLGEDFGPRYPPLVAEHRIEDALERTLYVGLQGSRVHLNQGRLAVRTKDDVEVLSVPSSHVARVVLFGSVGLAAGARSWLLAQGVEAVFLSKKGGYLGQEISAAAGVRSARLRSQVKAGEDSQRAMAFARAVVTAKIRHQATLVQRFTTREVADEVRDDIALMRSMLNLIPDASSASEIMGVEGAAAKAYFCALSHLLPAELGFHGRQRRPPLDVVNAALGYGYAILLGECVSALVAAGLEPSLGLLHSDNEQRPSLALDLMEEFRPYVVDQVVVQLCRRRGLTAAHGQTRAAEPGVFLTKAGKSALVDSYERRMLQVTGGAIPGFTGSLRRHIYRQAQRLARFVRESDTEWQGLSWR